MIKWAIELREYDISYQPRSAIKAQALAEFVNEATFIEGNEGNWLLLADGSSTLIGSGAGVVLTSPEGDELEYALHLDFKASNNEVGYEALIAGIKMALDAGVKNLIAYTDSQLVTKQVEGKYEIKEERMKGYLQEIGELASRLKSFQLHQIPRTENTKADFLVRIASSLVNCSTRSITVRTLIKNPFEIDIMMVQVETDWRKSLLDDLEKGIPPLMKGMRPA